MIDTKEFINNVKQVLNEEYPCNKSVSKDVLEIYIDQLISVRDFWALLYLKSEEGNEIEKFSCELEQVIKQHKDKLVEELGKINPVKSNKGR